MPTKMKFLSLPKNENESHLCRYHRTSIWFSCEHNIFGPTQMTFFGTKTKNKTKMKIHFWPKTEKAENDQIGP